MGEKMGRYDKAKMIWELAKKMEAADVEERAKEDPKQQHFKTINNGHVRRKYVLEAIDILNEKEKEQQEDDSTC